MKQISPKTKLTHRKFELNLICEDKNKRIHFLDVFEGGLDPKFYLFDFYGWPVPQSDPRFGQAKQMYLEFNMKNP